MDCLKGYIGTKGCGGATGEPLSGLYINELPGVNLEVMDSIADDEQETWVGVWADVEKRALLKFALAVKAELNKCYRIIDPEVVACLVCGSKDQFAVALWYFLGVELMIERTSSTRINRFTTVDREDADRLKAEFYAEFQAALTAAVQIIDPTDNECIEGCVESAAPVRWVERTP